MTPVTLLFPGQGSQYVGMGKQFLDKSTFKEVYERADEALGFSLSSLMLEGPDEKLALTQYTQPAIVTHSYAMFKQLEKDLKSNSLEVMQVLGHSVGEYSALVAAGALEFEDAIKSVYLRGKYMQEATPEGVGSMYAILRAPSDVVAKACENSSNEKEQVMCANFNDPTQIVISGHKNACEKAIEWLENNCEQRFMAKKLNVSAPFHCSLMKPAEDKLKMHLDSIDVSSNSIPYVANVDAKLYKQASSEKIRDNLTKQVCASVLWKQSIESLNPNAKFIEVGPGKVLTGLNKRINKDLKTFHMDQDNFESKLLEFFK